MKRVRINLTKESPISEEQNIGNERDFKIVNAIPKEAKGGILFTVIQFNDNHGSESKQFYETDLNKSKHIHGTCYQFKMINDMPISFDFEIF